MENQYNAQNAEKNAQELWQKHEIYAAKKDNNKPLFSIDTPPPTVSGSLHIGHIFSYTQADIIARYKRMSGFNVFYPFGFDDNGLATERFVEKKCNVSSFALGRTAFIQLCLEQTKETEKQFEALFHRMGLSIDWSYCYSTISKSTQKISQQSFIDLYKKGYIYRKEEPALYCPACRTSVAQAELEDQEKPSLFTEIVFKTEDDKELLIATTRPELLASCVALFYNPADARYKHLKDKQAIVPIYGHKVPILADEKVLIEKGTGLVMCCTLGDKTDIEWFKKYNLPYKPSIGRDGRMTDSAGFLKGQKVAEARQTMLTALKEAQLIRSQKSITHSVNIHERCKNDIEYLALPQWFLKLLPYKSIFIEQGNAINWYPAYMKSRYINWVENISWDWCLSRQRLYGVPFPVWYCGDCQYVIMADSDNLPVDPQESKPSLSACPACKSNNIIPDSDVMDTWNTSSLTPYICKSLGNFADNFIPMSMRPQAHDIIRTWAFYTIVKAWMIEGKIPWENIIISGHVLTGQGDKISKSQSNSPLIPENLLKLYPADVVRYWTACATLGSDVAFSESQLKIGQRLLVKLWNALKFVAEHADLREVYTPDEQSIVGIENKWIVSMANTVYEQQYRQYFQDNQFGLALHSIERFFWDQFCDNYLEIIKDQFFNPDHYELDHKESTKKVLGFIGMRILQMFAPFMPHITEIIYQEVFKKTHKTESIHQTQLALTVRCLCSEQTLKTMTLILDLIAQARKLKSDNQLSLKVDLDKLTILVVENKREALQADLTAHEKLIRGITRAKKINYASSGSEVGPDSTSRLESDNGSWHAYIVLT